MKCSIHTDMTPEEKTFVRAGLIEFADTFTEPRNYREFGIVLRDDDSNPVGGVTANTVWDWLQIDMFWIKDEFHGRGYGRGLLKAAESMGREMGCNFSKLDTFEFEAKELYEGNGYQVRPKTEDFPIGHTHYHL